MRCLLILCLLIASPLVVLAQQLDLGFEGRQSRDATYRTWFASGEGFAAAPDAAVKHGGRQSMRLFAVPFRHDHLGAWGAVIRRVPAALVAGHRLTFSAWVRTDSLLPVGVALFCESSKVHWETLDNAQSDTVRGTTGWQRLMLTTRISPQALDVLVGCRAGGWGRAWVDDVQLAIDGRPFDPATLPPAPAPTSAELAWLRGAAHPLRTTDPAAPDTTDLVAFGRLLGPARIIAMGEASHGTHEAMATKARLIRYLVAHHHLEAVILEASLPDAEYLNRYVLTGEGTALEGLRRVSFWSLGNQDVLDLVEWLRRYNQTAARPVQVVGCDMQDLTGAMTQLRDITQRYEPSYAAELARGLATLTRFNAVYNEEFYATYTKAPALTDSSLALSRSWLAHYAALGAARPEAAAALLSARVINQLCRLLTARKKHGMRDQFMAENTGYLLESVGPMARAVVWAHNGHLMRDTSYVSLGSALSRRFGPALLSVGFSFGEGSLISYFEFGPTVFRAWPPMEGSYETWFAQAGLPGFYLDLRPLRHSSPAAARWLTQPRYGRESSAVGVTESNSSPYDYCRDFDVLIYNQRVTPTVIVNRRPK